jgi:hypothetical protein
MASDQTAIGGTALEAACRAAVAFEWNARFKEALTDEDWRHIWQSYRSDPHSAGWATTIAGAREAVSAALAVFVSDAAENGRQDVTLIMRANRREFLSHGR